MTINRRDFVGGLAAAFAFGCPGWQAARAAGLAQGFNMPLSDARASGESFATLAGSIVPAGDTVRVEVTPVSAYGTRGRPIAATVDGDALRSGTAKFGGLSVVGI